MRRLDLNVDIGEGFPNDEALLEFATSANVCCGEHAGSWEQSQTTIELCLRRGIRLGMHPGFPDIESMGRRLPRHVPDEWLDSIHLQSKRFWKFCRPAYIKPHGAWYQALTTHDVDESVISAGSRGACAGALFGIQIATSLPVMILPDSPAAMALRKMDRPVIAEGFADRAYLPDGTLVARSEPGAILEDLHEIKYQVLRLAKDVDSICLHGDTPNCLEFAELVYRALVEAGYEVGY